MKRFSGRWKGVEDVIFTVGLLFTLEILEISRLTNA